ncbi:MAG: acyl-CoA dehydrogenase [Pseudomonadota bacterium]
MAEKFVSARNIKFLLYEVFDAECLTKAEYYGDHDRESFDMVLETALRLGRDRLWPLFTEMDRNQPQFVDGVVKVHPMVRGWMREAGEGGWIAAGAPYELEGQQLPLTISTAAKFIFGAANYAALAYIGLSQGAAHLIESFGSDELKETYIPKLFAGEWQGTMALTEPQAGSSLSDLATQAAPTDQGYYKIKGQKIFISAGDHDGVDNVVHLMLAKIKGAPAGVKGISLFVVPKKRIGPDGALTPNDLNTAGIYHKMGYRGTPIAQLAMGENDDCRGWLVGEPHKGLSYMFQMMNEARLDVGLGAAAIATAAYYASLDYARQRPQGRKVEAKDPAAPQVNIISHADIKRLLLYQRSVVEGALSLILQCAKYADLSFTSAGPDKEHYELLLDLLTPVAKTYPSEMGCLSVSAGVQILGGYGYCDEFPLEQYYRDMRIHPIHEGTTGIQGLDLLGRKAVMKNGRALSLFADEVKSVVAAAAQDPALRPYAAQLEEALEKVLAVTAHLTGLAGRGRTEAFLADASLFLEMFGYLAMAWQWLLQGLALQKALAAGPSEADAAFYRGKLLTMEYYFQYEAVKILSLEKRLWDDRRPTMDMKEELFAD